MEKELKKSIKHFFSMEPTAQQQKAIDKLVGFTFFSERFATFILSGYAGTGKTTLVGAYIKALNELKIKSVLLAPTGRAAKVLASKSKKTVSTIHKKIYRKRTLAGGMVQLELGPNLHKNTLFIVDEASMIGEYSVANDGGGVSRNLLGDLMEFVFSGEGCKLIFVGDEGQLPPVGSDYSPALDLTYLQNTFFSIKLFDTRLTDVVRQSLDSDILLNASNLRNYKGDTFPTIVTRKGGDVLAITGDMLQDELEKAYSDYGYDDVIVITKSNKRTNAYNQNIRNRIMYHEEEVNGGDRLMVVRNNYFWLEESSEAGFIANGEMLKLNRVVARENLYGFHFVRARVELIDYPSIGDFEVILLIDTIDSETPSLPRAQMKELFFAIEEDYAYERNKKKRYELISKDPYFNAIQVKYAYSITCHKAQGGQWPVVFLDHDYLIAEMLDASFLRWLYTGFTRASEKLFLVNFHKEFFDIHS
jgi:exodeoxyribonuclease-5